VEGLVRNIKDEPEESTTETNDEKAKKEPANTSYNELEKHLASFFNTKIEFKRGDKGNGKIIIPFKSDEDLERIIAILDKTNS
jgi:ParB family chromosome partitioning protein